MLIVSCIALLACLCCAMPVLSSMGPLGVDGQHPLLPTTSIPSTNYSVGFCLSSSYGAAAVVIDDANGEKRTLTWQVHGDLAYQKVMARLSLDSSRHLAPPYEGMDDYFADVPRVLARRALKKVGLPASIDVGILATVIKKLRAQIESDLGITVTDAVLATTHLEAIYEDDVEDICENAGFQHVTPKRAYRPMIYETGAAYGGYGFGWCKHWQNDTQCQKEIVELPAISILGVHYSETALTSTLAYIQTPVAPWEGYGHRVENFTLGSNSKTRYEREDEYWDDVKGAILKRMIETPSLRKPEMIIVTGDMTSDDDFQCVLKDGIEEHLGWLPPIYSNYAAVAAAKGAAELRRRGKAPWSK